MNPAPPYLRIVLGIVLKHHCLLEAAAHGIDNQLSVQPEKDCKGVASSLRTFGNNWRRGEKLKEEVRHFEGCVVLSDTEEERDDFQKRLTEKEDSLSELQHEPVIPRTGPVCS